MEQEQEKSKKPKAKRAKAPTPPPLYRFSCYECGAYFDSPATVDTPCQTCGGNSIRLSDKPVGNVSKYPESRLRGLKPFEEGCPPGPGRTPGLRSARDIYGKIGDAATPKSIMEKLEAQGIKPTQKELDDVIAYTCAVRAAAGNNGALKEYNDRRFGKAEQTIHANVFQIDPTKMSDEVKALAAELGLVDFT
jgi:hypothetical protein